MGRAGEAVAGSYRWGARAGTTCPACRACSSGPRLPFCVHCGAERRAVPTARTACADGDGRRLRPRGVDRSRRAARRGVAAGGDGALHRRDARTCLRGPRRACREGDRGRHRGGVRDRRIRRRGPRAPRRASHSPDAAGAGGSSNSHLHEVWGVRLENRTGVCTGEVVVGRSSDGHGVIAGEAIDLSTRMEQRAPPGRVLMTGSHPRAPAPRARTEPVVVPSSMGGPMTAHLLLAMPASPLGEATAAPGGDGAARACPVCAPGRWRRRVVRPVRRRAAPCAPRARHPADR